MTFDFLRRYPPEEPEDAEALWFVFQGGDLLIVEQPETVALPRGERALLADLAPGAPLYVGTLGGVPCLTCETDAASPLPEGWRPLGLRTLYGRLPDADYGLAGYAAQLLYWQRTSRYCSACGQPTEAMSGDWGRRCTACGHTAYPHVSPAMLALVHDGDRVLLGHKPGWGKRYSILAGFVEPGESLEQCVHREVMEEVGVTITDLVYQGSQPWPYPSQIMIGFTARYEGGEIRIDEKELDDAAWFPVDALPELPAPLSLSRQIIDAWAASLR